MSDSAITTAVLAYLNHAPTSEFNGLDVAIAEEWEGTDNLLWRVAAQASGQDAVLKLYLDAGQARSRRQFDGQQTFAPLGIAPRPLWYDRYPQGLARQILVYEWVPGQPIDATAADHIRALARTVAQIHRGDAAAVRRLSPNPLNLETLWRILAGGAPRLVTWLDSHSHELAKLFSELVNNAQLLVESALPLWHTAAPTPVHGDLKLENCLLGLGTAVLLDWELFGLGDPALDVAHLLYWNRLALAKSARDMWLDTYLALSPQTQLGERVAIYEQILPLQTLCYLLDGVHNMAADAKGERAGASDQLSAALEFLQETLQASLAEAANQLHVKTVDSAMLVAELCAGLAVKS